MQRQVALCGPGLWEGQAFLNPRELPATVNPEDARMRLASALEREIIPVHPSPAGSVRASEA